MPNSYVEYTYPNTSGGLPSYFFKVYDPSGGIDGYIDPDFLEVYLNNVKIPYNAPTKAGDPYWDLLAPLSGTQYFVLRNYLDIQSGSVVRMQRVTPNKLATFKGNVLEFFNTEVLNAEQLNLALKAMIHLVQEAKEQNNLVTTGGQYLPKDTSGSPNFWTAQGLDIRNLPATPSTANSATPKAWVEAAIAASGGPGNGTGGGGPWGTNDIIDNAITTAKIAPEAVDVSRLADNAVTTQKLLDDAVTTAKIEDNAITNDKIRTVNAVLFPGYNGIHGSKIAMGTIPGNRIDTATGNTDCIPMGANTRPGPGISGQVIQSSNTGSSFFQTSAYGRGLMNAADAAGLRTALGLGSLAALNTVTNAQVSSNAAISLSKLESITAATLVGNSGSQSAAPSTIALSSLTLNSWAQPTTPVNLGGQRCVNAASPIDPQDLATKGWVESQSNSWPGVYNGVDETNSNYPIGTSLLVYGQGTSAYALNSVWPLRYQTTTNTVEIGNPASGFIALTGTWRARGTVYFTASSFVNVQITLFTRTA